MMKFLAAFGLATLVATAPVFADDAPLSKELAEDASMVALASMCQLDIWKCSPGWERRLAACRALGIGCSSWRDGSSGEMPAVAKPAPVTTRDQHAAPGAVDIVRGR